MIRNIIFDWSGTLVDDLPAVLQASNFVLAQAGKDTGHSNYLFKHSGPIDDDHLPFKQRGVPVLDVIAYEYGPYDDKRSDYAYHHTAQDTMDKLSAQSLQVSADLFVDLLRLIDQH